MMTTTAPTPDWSHDGFCWRLTAPDGWRLDDDLHEYVYPSGAWSKREAMVDARDRMDLRPRQPMRCVPCTDPDCEWCYSEEVL